jgi:hypothetical protein
MPVKALKNLAKKHGISTKKAEKKWDEAKAIVSKEYSKDDPKYWGTVMNITKSKIKKHSKKKSKKESRIYDFETFLNEAKRDIDKEVSKINREERLKSGAKLGTKVIPDKKKQYKRKKKVDPNED